MKRVFLGFAALAALLVPASAWAGPAGFGDPVQVGSGSARQTAAAVNSSGRAVVAWTVQDGPSAALGAAIRQAAGRPWDVALVTTAYLVRDPQAVVTPTGQVALAWSELRRNSNQHYVVTASALPGLPLRISRRIRVPSAFSAAPRLTVLRSGGVLLTYRHVPRTGSVQVRTAFRQAGTDRFRDPEIVGRGAASLALAAEGSGAIVAWPSPAPRGGRRARNLYAQRLRNDGSAVGARILVSRLAGAVVRLAGAPGDRAIASWVRPARGPEQPPALFTRSLTPFTRPAQPLVPPVGRVLDRRPAAVVMDGGEALAAAATITDTPGAPFGFRVFAARSLFGGVWAARRDVAASPNPMVGDPRPLLPGGGEGLIVWSQVGSSTPGQVSYDVLIARRATATGSFGAPERLGGDLGTNDGRGVIAANAGSRVLVAWPASAGGLYVAERG